MEVSGTGRSYEGVQLAFERAARKAKLLFRVKFRPVVVPGFWNWKPPPEVPGDWWRKTVAKELNKDYE